MKTLDTKIDEYIEIACSVDVFSLQEIQGLKEILQECFRNPGGDYIIFEERVGQEVAGFIIFGRISFTEYSWDIYWLLVGKKFQGMGLGKKLLVRVEKFVLERGRSSILKVETSTGKEYSHARNLYTRHGYKEMGIIPDFYKEGDNLIVYYKRMVR